MVNFMTSGTSGLACLVFPPLGVSSDVVSQKEMADAARAQGLKLVAVDRPGIGGTDEVSERAWWSSEQVANRLKTHAADVAAVDRLVGPCDKAIAICGGAPYLLHFLRLASIKHVTFVTPWVSPDCGAAWRLPSLLLGRRLASYAAGALFMSFLRSLSSLEPTRAIKTIATKLTDPERFEFRRVDHEDLEAGARAHTSGALAADVAVLLSSYEEICGDAPIAADVTVFAADRDDLVPPAAVAWFVDRLCPQAALYFVQKSSHLGLQTLRRDLWLQAAAGHHICETEPPEDHPLRSL